MVDLKDLKEKVIDIILSGIETRTIIYEDDDDFDISKPESLFNMKGYTMIYKGVTEGNYIEDGAIIIDNEYYDLSFSKDYNIVYVTEQGKSKELVNFPFTEVTQKQRLLKLKKLELI